MSVKQLNTNARNTTTLKNTEHFQKKVIDIGIKKI